MVCLRNTSVDTLHKVDTQEEDDDDDDDKAPLVALINITFMTHLLGPHSCKISILTLKNVYYINIS